jgi:hypothetical protein
MCPFIVARQRLGKNVATETSTHTKIEYLLDASVSVRSVLYQKEVGNWFFEELLVNIVEMGHISF